MTSRDSVDCEHPSAGRCQASMRFHGGASRRFSIYSNAVCSGRSHPFLRFMAATNRTKHPSRSSERRCVCLSPWRLCRPRRTLVPQRVQWVHHRPVAADSPAPIPWWLTLRAIRLYCKSVTAARHPIQTLWLSLQSPNPGLPVAVETHAKQRVTSNGLRSFRMWKQARASLCASALIATTLFVLAFFRS